MGHCDVDWARGKERSAVTDADQQLLEKRMVGGNRREE